MSHTHVSRENTPHARTRPHTHAHKGQCVPSVAARGLVESLAAVVPLKTGGGTRLKILEAMAAGSPVVSTPLGADGLAIKPDVDYLPAAGDSHELWVRHLVGLASNPELSAQLIGRGLHTVRARYDWRSLGKQ